MLFSIVTAAQSAANEVEATFNNIKPEFKGGLDFSGVISAATSAAGEVQAKFDAIKDPIKAAKKS